MAEVYESKSPHGIFSEQPPLESLTVLGFLGVGTQSIDDLFNEARRRCARGTARLNQADDPVVKCDPRADLPAALCEWEARDRPVIGNRISSGCAADGLVPKGQSLPRPCLALAAAPFWASQ